MGDEAILMTNSFSVNVDEDQKKIANLFEAFKGRQIIAPEMPVNATKWNDIGALFKNRAYLAERVSYYENHIATINPVLYQYMKPEEIMAKRRELLHAFYMLSAQYRLDQIESCQLNVRSEKIYKCAELLDKFDDKYKKDELVTEKNYNIRLDTLQKQLKSQHKRFVGSNDFQPTQYAQNIVDFKSAVNGQRLSWVWGNASLNALIPIMEEIRKDIPDRFTHCADMKKALGDFSLFTGYMSWLLYYARFALNLWNLAKHTLFASGEEAKIDWKDRLSFHANKLKFPLLNDSIWGLANMATFLWLTGDAIVTSGLTMGWIGNILTIGLLVMDLSVAILALREERQRHIDDMKGFKRDIDSLKMKKEREGLTDTEKATLTLELEALETACAQAKMKAYYKETDKKYDLYYAAALIGAFCVMGGVPSFVLALGGIGVSLGLPLVGALLSFVFNTVYNTKKSWLEIQQKEEIGYLAELELGKLRNIPNPEDDVRLKITQLESSIAHQDATVRYATKDLLRRTLVDVMLPITVFVALMTAPSLPIALGIMIASALLACLIKYLLKEIYTAPDAKIPTAVPKNDQLKADQVRFFPTRPRTLTSGFIGDETYKNEDGQISYSMIAAA